MVYDYYQYGKGYFKGKKRQRGGKRKKKQRGAGKITEQMSKKILSEFSKAANYGKKLARSTKSKVQNKFRNFSQKGGIVSPRRGRYRTYPEKYLMY